MDMSDAELDFDAQIGLEEEDAFLYEGFGMEGMLPPDSPGTESVQPSHESGQTPSTPVSDCPSPPSAPQLPIVPPPTKRPRICTKSTWLADAGRYAASIQDKPDSEPIAIVPNDAVLVGRWSNMDHRGKWVWSNNRMVRVGHLEYLERLERSNGGHARYPLAYSKLAAPMQREVAVWWVNVGTGRLLPEVVKDWIRVNFRLTKKEKADRSDDLEPVRMRSKQLMFTCQGDWGLLVS